MIRNVSSRLCTFLDAVFSREALDSVSSLVCALKTSKKKEDGFLIYSNQLISIAVPRCRTYAIIFRQVA